MQAGTYTFSVTYSQAFETTKAHLSVYDVGTDTRLNVAYNNTKVSFTLENTTDIAIVVQNSGLTTSDILTAQLELGSTATDFEPYTGTPISVSWQTEAGTVYGGTVDVVTGVLTVTHKSKVYTGQSSEQWTYSDWTKTLTYVFYSAYDVTDAEDNNALQYCNYIPVTDYGGLRDDDVDGIAFTGNHYTSIRIQKALIASGDSAGIMAYLADHPLEIVYKLRNPQTYQLTPQQIETLVGQNNVWADTGDVSVTYQASIKRYIDKVLGS